MKSSAYGDDSPIPDVSRGIHELFERGAVYAKTMEFTNWSQKFESVTIFFTAYVRVGRT